MQSPENQRNQAYIRVARACLKAINEAPSQGPTEQQVQRVYNAIDRAFDAEYKRKERQLAQAMTVLGAVASYEGDDEEAQALSQQAKDVLKQLL